MKPFLENDFQVIKNIIRKIIRHIIIGIHHMEIMNIDITNITRVQSLKAIEAIKIISIIIGKANFRIYRRTENNGVSSFMKTRKNIEKRNPDIKT